MIVGKVFVDVKEAQNEEESKSEGRNEYNQRSDKDGNNDMSPQNKGKEI